MSVCVNTASHVSGCQYSVTCQSISVLHSNQFACATCFSLGIVLNVINTVVLRDKRLKESSYTYLAALAVADSCSLLMFGLNGVGRGHFPDHYGWQVFQVFVYFPVCLSSTSTSVFLIVTVTLERFLFLYRPLAARICCNRRMARRVVVAITLFSVVINVPRFFVFRITPAGDMQRTWFGNSIFYKTLTWLFFLLVAVGCGLVLIVINALLINGIQRVNDRRQMLTRSADACGGGKAGEKSQERRLTRTLVSVTVLYLVGELPSCIFSRLVFTAILGPNNAHVTGAYWYLVAEWLATVCAVSQHSLNFVFYCIFNKRFYQVFRIKCLTCSKTPTCREHSELASIAPPAVTQ